MGNTGSCLCGAVSYVFEGEPITVALCHCDHCQRQSGSAFSINLVMPKTQLNVTGELTTFDDRGRSGDAVYVYRRFCSTCGSPIMSEGVDSGGIVALKAGTLDDRSAVTPGLQVWCDDKQPWVDIADVPALDQEP